MTDLEIILKSPTDRVAPFSVNCGNSWTVKDLKNHIQDIYPCKPKVETQKLIFAGKLLSDDQILKNIFEKDSNSVVHLICQSSVNSTEELKRTSDKKDETSTPSPDLYEEYQTYLNQYYSSQMNQCQQMMQLNNAYMQSYASIYGKSIDSKENIDSSTQRSEEVQAHVSNDTSVQENPPENQQPVAPVADNGVQNMMAAAFGGIMGDGGDEENDGEIEPRDILHYFYMFVRFGLLLLICYYYSSMASVVTTLMLFFIFFGVNLFRRNNRVNQQIEVVLPPENVPTEPLVRPVNEEGDEHRPVEANITGQTLAPEPLPGMTDRLRRVASTSIQFVVAFFVTLFPDPVAHIDVH